MDKDAQYTPICSNKRWGKLKCSKKNCFKSFYWNTILYKKKEVSFIEVTGETSDNISLG